MFFKKDLISEEQIVALGITSATVCYIVEQKYPPQSNAAHVKYVNDSVDSILKSLKLNPSSETINFIRVVTSALANNTDNFISKRLPNFQNGDKSVQASEISAALKIVEKSVSAFTNGR